MKDRGDISTTYTAWCGNSDCANWQDSHAPCTSRSQAVGQFMADGWRKQRQVGWLCPDCVKKNAGKPLVVVDLLQNLRDSLLATL